MLWRTELRELTSVDQLTADGIGPSTRRMEHSIQLVLRVHELSKSFKHLTTWHSGCAVPRVSLLVVRITLLYTVHQ